MAASQNRPGKLLYLGILAVIPAVFAIVVLIYSQINSAEQANACEQEYHLVQSALDSYMAYYDVTTVLPTNDMTQPVPLLPASTNDMTQPVPSYELGGTPTYARSTHTTWTYTWDAAGRVTAISQTSGGPPVPVGCAVSG